MKVSWLIENRIVLIEVEDTLTLDDVTDLNTSVKALLVEGGENTHVMSLIGKLDAFPSNLGQLSRLLDYHKHPNIGWNIAITDNRVVRFLGALLYKVSGNSTLKFVATYEDARKLLRELDETLPELPEKTTP